MGFIYKNARIIMQNIQMKRENVSYFHKKNQADYYWIYIKKQIDLKFFC